MAITTPIYNLNNFPEVYEPREDTFLFIDALEAEFNFLRLLQPKSIVEIGSGSGIVITAMSFILGDSAAYFATDINKQACEATKTTAKLNKINIECLKMNLLDSFKKGMFDVILFNPPYVVTSNSEIKGQGLSRAWAGGINGRVVIDELLGKLGNILNKGGICYMVLLKENRPEEVVEILQEKGFDSKMVMERRVLGEHLFIYRFYKL